MTDTLPPQDRSGDARKRLRSAIKEARESSFNRSFVELSLADADAIEAALSPSQHRSPLDNENVDIGPCEQCEGTGSGEVSGELGMSSDDSKCWWCRGSGRRLASKERIREALASHAPPDRMVLVPREPTPEMIYAGEQAINAHIMGEPNGTDESEAAYKAMIAAAPSAPSKQNEE